MNFNLFDCPPHNKAQKGMNFSEMILMVDAITLLPFLLFKIVKAFRYVVYGVSRMMQSRVQCL
jgi:hypothetical protein